WRSPRSFPSSSAPVTAPPNGSLVWIVTRYEEVRQALSETRLSKDFKGLNELMAKHTKEGHAPKQYDEALVGHMLASDPPDHTRMRRLVNKAFTPRRVESMRPMLRELTTRLLDEMEKHDEIDLLEALAYPVPMELLCTLLGVPEAERLAFGRYAAVVLSDLAPEGYEEATRAMREYLVKLIQVKRDNPGDDWVRPLLDGSGRRAPSADPARVLTHAVGANRGAGFLPDGKVTVTGGRLCSAVDPDPAVACLGEGAKGASPHFAQWATARESGRHAIALRWTSAGSPTRVRPARPVSLRSAESLALRVFVPPDSRGTRLDVSVTDAHGRRATLGRVQVDGLPGSDRTASYWARELRVPLTAARAAGVDLGSVKSLELTPRSGSGQAWLMDAWGWRPGTPAVRAAALPRVDVGRVTVDEGDSGVRTYHVPVRVSGHGSGRVRVYVVDPATGTAKDRVVTARPGGHDVDVPVEVRGNTRFGTDVSYDVLVKAVRGTVVGSYQGGLTVRNDDPAPTVTVTPLAGEVTEGSALKWRISLSEAADTDIASLFVPVPVTGPELSTKDVDPRWLADASGAEPDPERPLSKVEGLYLWLDVPAGRTSLDVTVPTVKDQVREDTETVTFQQTDDEGSPLPGGLVLTGRVLDAP
ncbi:hypothetical protein ABZ372_28805, partial [Streptomyces sp. NPDC005921]